MNFYEDWEIQRRIIEMDKFVKTLNTKAKATKFLKKVGILNSKGKLSKRYGGK